MKTITNEELTDMTPSQRKAVLTGEEPPKRISLKHTALENDLIRRVEKLEREVMILYAALGEKLDLCLCDQCPDGRESFFFPKLHPLHQIWFEAGGLLSGGLAWCAKCLNDKWTEISATFDANEYADSCRDVAIWVYLNPTMLFTGSALSLWPDLREEMRKIVQ